MSFYDQICFAKNLKEKPMHKRQFCHKLFEKALPKSLHSKRRDCLTRFVSSLLNYDIQLSVAEIGKHLDSKTTVKHKIKSADYFANNEGLASEIPSIYQGLANYFYQGYECLTVLVDWSGACSDGYYVLKASAAAHGRSIPIYQEIHSGSQQEKCYVHNEFLENLKKVIPEHIKVTVITDAGFHRDWFNKVLSLGWDFIGRVYSRYHYRPKSTEKWCSVANIKFGEKGEALSCGEVELGKTGTPLPGYLYTYKEKLSEKPHKKNPYPSSEKAYSNYYRNGWVIISSIETPANEMIKSYKKRMQIEQNFRDIKNERYGVGLRRNDSKSLIRITMLYFLATLIIILLWWIGLITEHAGEHIKYQANTRRDKRIISFIHLARMVLRQNNGNICWYSFRRTVKKLRSCYLQFMETGILI